MAGFANYLVTKTGYLVRTFIRSFNYVAGVSGWTINKDGSAEFNNLTVRGTFKGTDYIINAAGAFFYNGAPAAGNLIASIASVAGTDGFTNVYQQGIVAYASTGTYSQLTNGELLLDNFPGGIFLAMVGSVLTIGSITPGVSSVNVTMPFSSPLAASLPGTPGTAETWHLISLDAGWSAAAGFDAPQYQLMADGKNVQLRGAATHAGFNASTALNSGTPLAGAYQPAETHHYRGVDNLSTASVRSGVQITPSGVITALTNGTACTLCEIDGIYPLN